MTVWRLPVDLACTETAVSVVSIERSRICVTFWKSQDVTGGLTRCLDRMDKLTPEESREDPGGMSVQ
jgi:hypothetical protein